MIILISTEVNLKLCKFNQLFEKNWQILHINLLHEHILIMTIFMQENA